MALTLNGTTGLSGIAGSAGTPALQGNNDTNTGYFFGTDILGLSTAGSERLRITAAGNLALGNDGSFPIYTDTNDRNFILGTGSDDAAIQLHSGTNKFGGLYFGDATSGGDRYSGYVEYKHDDNYLRFATGGTEKLRITSTGKVGIGTTSPNSKLQVASGHINIDSGYSFQWDDSYERIEQSDGKIEFFTNNGEKMTLSGSNLGIGTITPTRNLHLHSTSVNTQVLMQVSNATTGSASGDGFHIGINSSQEVLLQNKENTKMTLLTNDNARITIANDGHCVFSNSIALDGETAAANRLSDYEEGTFTPVWAGNDTAGTINYGQNMGRYTKIGNVVNCNGYTQINSAGTAAGYWVMTLPFDNTGIGTTSPYETGSCMLNNFDFPAAMDDASAWVVTYKPASNTKMYLYYSIDAGAWAPLSAAHDTTWDIIWSLSYKVA